MPELPEVEVVKSGLARLLPGRVVAQVDHSWQKSFPNEERDVARALIGATIVSVRRRAKVLLIALSTDYSLVIHLKMTGQLVFRGAGTEFGGGHPNDSLVGDLPDKSTRVILGFQDGSHLYFNDQRKFGWMRLMSTKKIDELPFMQKVGPEPLDKNFTAQDFILCLRRRNNSGIKAVLLDQTVVAGIGNIYADESLWGAKIHPETRVKDISDARLTILYGALIAVLRLSIEKGGSTNSHYVDAEGRKGSYMSFAHVFRREGKPCSRCNTIIIKLRVAGRGTHICPHCQRKRIVREKT